MIYDRLRVFVSSSMQELAPERAAIRSALSELHMEGWVFEEDAGARAQTIQQTYKQEIDNADLYVGLFWRGYGDYTIDEFNYAREKQKDRLIYEKRSGIDGHRDARLQAFLDQIGKVDSGLTVKWFDTPEELREAIKDDAARWQAGKVRELREQNVNYRSSPVELDDQRALKILLEKVRHFWIDGVLEKSTQRERLLELGKDAQAAAVENPWEAILELPYEGTRAVPSEKGILEVFEDVQHSLLILGQPGSGKTTTLLTLARELIKRAEADPARPIPVVFNLSSWSEPEQPLATWLENELSARYQIPKKIGSAWLEHNRLLLLLDGLDEVKQENRAACVSAINHYTREIGLPGLTVCCRIEPYEELDAKLALNGAVSLRPLTNAQIDTYVEESGAALAGLRSALSTDSALQELARSPLMLSLMCLAYRDHGADDLAAQGSPTDHARHLFATYIDRAFAKRGKAELAYPREQTLAWLSWIAGRLSERNQTMFLIEDLQPDWFSTRLQRWAYLAIVSLVLGLVIGFVNISYWSTSALVANDSGLDQGEIILWLTAMPAWFLAIGWAEGIGAGRPLLERVPAGVQRAAVKALVCSVALALIAFTAAMLFSRVDNRALLNLMWAGVPIILLLAAKGANRSINFSVKTIDSVGWSPRIAWRGALLGLLGGLAVGAFAFLPGFDFEKLAQAKKWIFCLGFGTVGMALGGLLGGLEPRVFKGKTEPNQGIRFSLKMAVLMGLNAVWLVAIVWLFARFGGFDNAAGLEAVLGYVAAMFTALFLWFGGIEVLKHYVVRFVLTASRQVPWNLSRLLDHARDLNLMQKVGNGYIFVHRRLLEHLAASG
ncbi:MAG: DUF4062 domain-containing protein, partial [Burkholderiales bacterium]